MGDDEEARRASGEWLALAVLAGAAIVTKPDDASFERMIDEDLRREFASPSNVPDDGLGQLIQLGCVFASTECAQFVGAFMRYGTADSVVAKVGAIRLGEAELRCIGAFQNWWRVEPKGEDA